MSKSINTSDTVNLNLSGSVDVKLEPITATVGSSIAITQLPVIQIAVTQLPRIDLRFGIAPTRIHFPVNMKFAICALGKELLSFATCGESMIVIEDYVPHRMELCS